MKYADAAFTVVVLTVGFAMQANATPADAYNRTTDTKKIGWMDRGMDSVKRKLRELYTLIP